MNSGITGLQDKRRFVRAPYVGHIALRDERTQRFEVVCRDVGRGGLCVETDQALHPGQRLMAEVNVAGLDEPVELKTVVSWIAPFEEAGRILVGLRVLHSEPESVTAMSALLHAGLHQSGAFTVMTGGGSRRTDALQGYAEPARKDGLGAGLLAPLAYGACAAICAMVTGAALL